MGLKCSVIGHKYGETAVERDREEQGSEVVITIREEETCERCGKTRVVSENKEVTSIETPSDIAGDMIDEETDDGTEQAATAEEPESGAGEESDGVEDIEADESAAGGTGSAVEQVDPDADDAEIIDAEEPAETAATESGDDELDDPSTVADAEEPEPATDPEEDDGVIIDADDEGAADTDRDPGQWPEEPGDDDDGWAPETGTDRESEAESESESGAGSDETTDVEPFGGNAVTVPNGEFRCPECDFTTDVASSSLRAGDFCPECHKGALINTAE